VRPISGGPSGVIGRNPHQKVAARNRRCPEKVADRMLERAAPDSCSLRSKPELRSAANADALA
jgi:hypothetical protein